MCLTLFLAIVKVLCKTYLIMNKKIKVHNVLWIYLALQTVNILKSDKNVAAMIE